MFLLKFTKQMLSVWYAFTPQKNFSQTLTLKCKAWRKWTDVTVNKTYFFQWGYFLRCTFKRNLLECSYTKK